MLFTRVWAGAVAGVLYMLLSQVFVVAYLFVATWRGWHVPGYHEPPAYHWWSLLLFALWWVGLIAAVWWASFRSRYALEASSLR